MAGLKALFFPALLFLFPPVCGATEISFPGLSASLGPRLTTRITFDKKKAASGGMILAAPELAAEDLEALRLSAGVLTTSGGFLSFAGTASRERRIPSMILAQASWGKEGSNPVLIFEEPVFSSSRKGDGFKYQIVKKSIRRSIREGDVVTLDSEKGLLIIYPLEEQPYRLALAEALRAYDGLKDAQALIQWFAGLESRARALAGPRLIEEIAQRAAEGTAPAEDLSRIRRKVSLSREAERDIWSRRLNFALDHMKAAENSLKKASSFKAAARLSEEARISWERISALSKVLAQDQGLPQAAAVFQRISDLSRRRLKELSKEKAGLADIAAAARAALPEREPIPDEFYRRFLKANGLEVKVEEIAADASINLRGKSERIRKLIKAGGFGRDLDLQRELEALVPSTWSEFAIVGLEGSRRASRQSLFAGVKEAWSDLWNPAALGARKRQGRALSNEEMTVHIQELVPADASGLILTRDPASGSRARMTVDAVSGEIDDVLSAKQFPDHYILSPEGREIIPAFTGERRVLSPERLKQLSNAAAALENYFGCGLEIRFSFSGDKLFLLLIRPLT